MGIKHRQLLVKVASFALIAIAYIIAMSVVIPRVSEPLSYGVWLSVLFVETVLLASVLITYHNVIPRGRKLWISIGVVITLWIAAIAIIAALAAQTTASALSVLSSLVIAYTVTTVGIAAYLKALVIIAGYQKVEVSGAEHKADSGDQVDKIAVVEAEEKLKTVSGKTSGTIEDIKNVKNASNHDYIISVKQDAEAVVTPHIEVNAQHDGVGDVTKKELKQKTEETQCDKASENVDAKLNNLPSEAEVCEREAMAAHASVLSDQDLTNSYRPVAIDVFANDAEIPQQVEIIKNEFVPTGKFVEYEMTDKTRGKYEEIEDANERKVSTMSDLSKIIITSNVNATIVPIETQILPRFFTNKMCLADHESKVWYSRLKNLLLSYVGVKSRVSKTADTFKYNGEVICKITMAGKTLLLNLNLDAQDYDSTYYKITDMGSTTKYSDTPVQIRIKNRLAIKRGLEITQVMLDKLGASSINSTPIDYSVDFPPIDNAVLYTKSIAHLIRK